MSRGVTVAQALQALGLTRLTHFTPAMNLYHIVEDGQIVSSQELAEHAADYFSPTDRERFDEHPEMVCCNFEYPNGYYLAKARQKAPFTNYPDWVCLLLDPVLLTKPGALFCVGNAAKARGRNARAGGQSLLDCFAPVSPWTPGTTVGGRIIPARLPTSRRKRSSQGRSTSPTCAGSSCLARMRHFSSTESSGGTS